MQFLKLALVFLPALVCGVPLERNSTGEIPVSSSVARDSIYHMPGTEPMPEPHRPQMPATILELTWLKSWNVFVWRRHRFETRFVDGASLNRSDWEHLCWEWRDQFIPLTFFWTNTNVQCWEDKPGVWLVDFNSTHGKPAWTKATTLITRICKTLWRDKGWIVDWTNASRGHYQKMLYGPVGVDQGGPAPLDP